MGMILAFLRFEEFANFYDKSHFANAIVLYRLGLANCFSTWGRKRNLFETLSLFFSRSRTCL